MTRDRHFFFTSTHYGRQWRYNEVHPCNITRTGMREFGWYWNSNCKLSKFRGYRLGPLSFGMISGYRNYKIPYITFHYKNMFIVPTFLLLQTRPAIIVCTYGDKTWSGAANQIWSKLREKKSNKKTSAVNSIETEANDASEIKARFWFSRYF